MATIAGPEVRWFTGARMQILLCEETATLIRSEEAAGGMPPLHVHHDHDELFYVVEGRLSLFLPEATVELGPGEAAFAPRGVPHTYRVEEDAVTLVTTTSGAFGSFVREMSVPAADDGFAPPGALPGPAELTECAARHGIEILGPPGALPG
jgi:quercetin dioxygenase-like cupin family protein